MTQRIASLTLSALIAIAVFAPTGASAADDCTGARYQIHKATKDRVWRLNRCTGTIEVCALSGDRLVCTSSQEATRPPKESYKQRQARLRRERADAEAAERRRHADKRKYDREQKDKDITLIRRIIRAIESIITATVERDAER